MITFGVCSAGKFLESKNIQANLFSWDEFHLTKAVPYLCIREDTAPSLTKYVLGYKSLFI